MGKGAEYLGTPVIFQYNDYKLFAARVRTKIVNCDEKYNPDFMNVLARLNFQIENTDKKFISVLLPPQWIHMQSNKNEELICDSWGRVRLIIYPKERRCLFTKRFSVNINVVESDTVNIINCKVMDYDKVIKEFTVGDDLTGQRFWEKMTKDKMIQIAQEQCEQHLTENFPLWRDDFISWDY